MAEPTPPNSLSTIKDSPVLEKSPLEELSIEKNTAVAKLSERIKQDKTPDIVCLDMDGTIYVKRQNPDGSWVKEGDNSKLQVQLDKKNIPLVIVSGRPDWGNADQEIAKYGLNPPDIVIVGAGSLIYWRTPDGELKIDEGFLTMMKNQLVTIRHDNETWQTFSYGEGINTLREYLDSALVDFKNKGVTQVKIDRNQGANFVTLDLSNISFDDLRSLVNKIKEKVQGVKVEFSEDIEKVSEEKFTGWMQIIPASGGKDKAIRYILEKIAGVINPSNEEAKKPHALCFGDAAIDILMLAFGTGDDDPYKTTQYLTPETPSYKAGYLTPYAERKLRKVFQALNKASPLSPSLLKKARKAHLEIIPEEVGYPEALEKVVSSLE